MSVVDELVDFYKIWNREFMTGKNIITLPYDKFNKYMNECGVKYNYGGDLPTFMGLDLLPAFDDYIDYRIHSSNSREYLYEKYKVHLDKIYFKILERERKINEILK